MSIKADIKVEIIFCDSSAVIDLAVGCYMFIDVDLSSLLYVAANIIKLLLNFFNLFLTLLSLLHDCVVEAVANLEEFLSLIDLMGDVISLLKLCISLLQCLCYALLD